MSETERPEGLESADSEARRTLGVVDQSFYLIGVGASAGGLDAINQMIKQVPADFPHSFVIIQHLSPDYKSLMSEILARETALKVIEVQDDMPIEGGHIYLIPPRSNVVIQGTNEDTNTVGAGHEESDPPLPGLRFSLVPPPPRMNLNLPVDLFFHSLAEAVRDRGIAIVLSGTGSDGSRGLRAIKDRDGLVIVQEPKTAEFDGMPRSALATGIVDLVLSPDIMVSELRRYFEMRESGIEDTDALFLNSEAEFQELLRLVSERAHIDFTQYKEPTLKRRLARRIALRECSTVQEYLEFTKANPSELSIIYREFLVGVTNFFRDLPVWKELYEKALPGLFAEGDQQEPVRVWSVACSTGEEPYSIAMMMELYRRENAITRDFRIFATDVDDAAINAAKDGVYSESVAEEIPKEYLESNFLSYGSGTFTVSRMIRNKVVFAQHNVMVDAPYIRTDLIICRNLLIYLSPEVQSNIMAIFSYSLRKNGYLLLGAAEHSGRSSTGFEPVVQKMRIYRNVHRSDRDLSRGMFDLRLPKVTALPRARRLPTRENNRSSDSLASAFTTTLSRLECSVFIVDEGGTILETFGDYRKIVQMPERGFSANLLDLVDERLRSSVSLLLRKSETEEQAEKLGLKFPAPDGVRVVDILCHRTSWETYPLVYMLTFRKTNEIPLENQPGPGTTGALVHEESELAAREAYISQLESEIESLQEMLSATSEDLGVANEELQTTNEELIASNEELQANNEEMQSINEELHTVNSEHVEKISQLERANADVENLLDNVNLAALFLSHDLRIRRFSVGMTRYMKFERSDIGRPISNFASILTDSASDGLMKAAMAARERGEDTTSEVLLKDGGVALLTVRPFQTEMAEPRGVVIKLHDLSEIRSLQNEIILQRDRLEGLLESEAAGYWDWNIPDHTEYMSPRFKEMFGYLDHEIENTPDAWMKIIHPDDLPGVLETYQAHVDSRGTVPYDNEVRYFHKDGSIVWVLCRGRVIEWGEEGEPLRMLGVHLDITYLKEREEETRRRAEEIRRFAFVAAHDLLQPMNTIELSLDALREEVPALAEQGSAELSEFIEAATGRMKTRITGILEYARLQDDQLEFEALDLEKIISGCLDDMKGILDENGAKVEIAPLPQAMGAPGLITRVFQNLISNSAKYRSSARDCLIRIEARNDHNGRVIVRVVDNGIGIEPEDREKVLQLFVRLHREDDIEGSGLGLALCDRIVSLHGGSIRIEDGVDGGVAVVFTLPGMGADDA